MKCLRDNKSNRRVFFIILSSFIVCIVKFRRQKYPSLNFTAMKVNVFGIRNSPALFCHRSKRSEVRARWFLRLLAKRLARGRVGCLLDDKISSAHKEKVVQREGTRRVEASDSPLPAVGRGFMTGRVLCPVCRRRSARKTP